MILRSSISFLAAAALLGAAPRAAMGQTTTWTTGIGNWGAASNWSGGEPTADTDAVLPGISGTAIVNMPGEVCRSFTSGTVGGGSTLQIDFGGSLAVAEQIRIGAAEGGVVHHNAGTLTARDLVLASDNGLASYLIFAGSLTVERAVVGGLDPSSGGFSSSGTNPNVRITRSLFIDEGGSFVFGSGTLNVGTTSADSTIVKGAFQIANNPAMTTTEFFMTPEGFFGVTLIPGLVPKVTVTGTAVLDGQLFVGDLGVPDGTYEVLTGNPVLGAFDMVTLPNDWSWRVEGNSLLLTKGQVPVESATWGRLKSLHRP